MRFKNILTILALATIVAGCSTTTVRSIQELESNNNSLYISYGETVVQKDLFTTQLISNDQKVAKCADEGRKLTCTSMVVSIDGKPLKHVQK